MNARLQYTGAEASPRWCEPEAHAGVSQACTPVGQSQAGHEGMGTLSRQGALRTGDVCEITTFLLLRFFDSDHWQLSL